MESLKSLTNENLLDQTKSHVASERRISTLILHHLNEVERRSLHLMGYSSLFAYMTEELKYTPGSAHRRINSMRLLKGAPNRTEIEKKISSGEVSLTTLSLVQDHFRIQKKKCRLVAFEEKAQLIEAIAGKSKLEVEKLLAAKNPEIRSNKNPTYGDIIEEAVDGLLEKGKKYGAKIKFAKEKQVVDILEASNSARGRSAACATNSYFSSGRSATQFSTEQVDMHFAKDKLNKTSQPGLKSHKTQSRYISKKLKWIIKNRDNGICTYKSPITGKICGSKVYLQYDHIRPVARGGITSLENLQLLCGAHNRFKGVG